MASSIFKITKKVLIIIAILFFSGIIYMQTIGIKHYGTDLYAMVQYTDNTSFMKIKSYRYIPHTNIIEIELGDGKYIKGNNITIYENMKGRTI